MRGIDGLVCLVFGFLIWGFEILGGLLEFWSWIAWLMILGGFLLCVFDFGDLNVWVFKGFVCFTLMVLILIV